MTDKRILLKIRNYIISRIQEKRKINSPNFSPHDYCEELEGAKALAIKYWDYIYELKKDSSTFSIRIEHKYSGEIYVFYNNNSYIAELENFCKCDAFLPILSIIAENTPMNGKFHNWHRYPVRGIDFSFK